MTEEEATKPDETESITENTKEAAQMNEAESTALTEEEAAQMNEAESTALTEEEAAKMNEAGSTALTEEEAADSAEMNEAESTALTEEEAAKMNEAESTTQTEEEATKMNERESACSHLTQSQAQDNSIESRRRSVQKYAHRLAHASKCTDSSCPQDGCEKMKEVLTHAKSCRENRTGSCPICKHLVALCCYHAKHCHVSSTECRVPYCQRLKDRLEQQRRLYEPSTSSSSVLSRIKTEPVSP